MDVGQTDCILQDTGVVQSTHFKVTHASFKSQFCMIQAALLIFLNFSVPFCNMKMRSSYSDEIIATIDSFNSFEIVILLLVYMCVLPLHMSMHHVRAWCLQIPDLLGLELTAVVNCHVGAGN